MKNYSEISIRYMKQNRKRTTLTILGITLATVLVFAIGTFLLSFKDSMLKQAREGGDFEFVLNDIPLEKAEKVANNVEVKNTKLCYKSDAKYTIKYSEYIANVVKADNGYYKKVAIQELEEGEYPSENDEVTINSLAANKLNVNVGDSITVIDENNNEKTYKISGIIKISGYSGKVIDINVYLNKKELKDSKVDIFVNLKSDKDKQEIISKVIKDAGIEIVEGTKNDNSQVLYLTGNGGNEGMNSGLRNIAIFVIAIIIICTVTVIYNSFNISVIERIKYFGILKSIGATNNQIKKIIYREGFLMGLIAYPLGCIIGFLTLKYGIKIFIGNQLLFMDFEVGFYPIILLLTAIIVLLTIVIALLGPTRKIKKISAVEAMRNVNEIKVGKIKKRKTRLIGKIFGIEGSLAYKNIRRTPMRFIITLIALTISIVLFNVFYSFMDFSKQIVDQQFLNISFDSQLKKVGDVNFTDDEIEYIDSLGYFKDIYKVCYKYESLIIPKESRTKEENDHSSVYEDYGYTSINTGIYGCAGEKELNTIKDYIIDGSVDYDKMKDNGVILVDGMKAVDENGNKKIIRLTDYKVGDKIKLTRVTEAENINQNIVDEAVKNNTIEATVVGISNECFLTGGFNNKNIEVIFLKDVYNKLVSEDNYNIMTFKFDNDKNREEAIKYFDEMSNESDLLYQDLGDMAEEITTVYNQLEFFVYCFITAITIISIVNIFNTISTNLLLRKKEFSTLKAIGMTEKQLSKSIILEGTLYGIMSAIVGGVLSIVLSNLLIKAGGAIGDVTYNFPYVAFSISILAAITVTYVSTIIPLKRLRKLTIVEGISDDE